MDGLLSEDQNDYDANAECANCHTALREHNNWECPPLKQRSGRHDTFQGAPARVRP